MKSKTSCFNHTIFKKNLSQYGLLALLYLGWLMLKLPIRLFLEMKQVAYAGITQTAKQYIAMSETLDAALQPLTLFLFAGVMAMAVFSYLYFSRSANMVHALPVNRLELFITNYITGMGFLLIPELLAFVAAVFVCLGSGITCIQYLFWWLLDVMGISLFAFSMAVFVAMFTGNIFAMAVYDAVANYLYVGCYYLAHLLAAQIGYGISDTWNPGASCILSPAYYINNNVCVKRIYGSDNYVSGILFSGSHLVIIYAVAAVGLTAAAYLLYRRRKVETAGDIISIGAVKPIFRWGVAICGAVALAQQVTNLLQSYMEINQLACTIAAVLFFCILCFFAAEMLLQKRFRVFTVRRLAECAACAAVVVIGIILIRVDAFGIEKKLPAAEEVEMAYIYMDYPVAEEDTEEILSLHKNLIAHKAQYQNLSMKNDTVGTVRLRYYLKDNTMLERVYTVPLDEETLQNESTPTAIIRSIEGRPENVKKYIFDSCGENASFYAGYVERINDEGSTNNYSLTAEQIQKLLQAVEQDITDGNFNEYLFFQSNQEVSPAYWNSISLEFSGGDYMSGVWYGYEYYREKEAQPHYENVTSGNIYISNFGPKCVHVLDALYSMGIIDDEWKLVTTEEYEELLK